MSGASGSWGTPATPEPSKGEPLVLVAAVVLVLLLFGGTVSQKPRRRR